MTREQRIRFIGEALREAGWVPTRPHADDHRRAISRIADRWEEDVEKIQTAVVEMANSYTNEEGSAMAAFGFKAELDQWFHYEQGR